MLPDIVKTLEVFFDTIFDSGDHPAPPYGWVKQANKDMVKILTGYEWKPRDTTKKYIPDKSLIKSGDLFTMMAFSGMGPILEYGMGGRSSHVVMAIWDTNEATGEEELYIAESRGGNDWPQTGIQRNLFDVWIDCVQKEEDSVVWLQLRDEFSKKFDKNKAWEFFKTIEGLPYGYNNVLSSWLDTPDKNYPPLVDINFFYTMLMLLEQRGVTIANQLMGESLANRLGKKGLTYPEIIVEADKQNKSIQELGAIPEQQGIEYSIGQSYVCSALVTALFKAGGIFDSLDILPNEFTPRDTYQISLFKDGSDRPDECKQNDPELPYCQLMGDSVMELEGFNTVEIYSHMNEKCPSMPPFYNRDIDC